MFCGMIVLLWPFVIIMNGDTVDTMDSGRDGWNAMQWIVVWLMQWTAAEMDGGWNAMQLIAAAL
jgi:hypothetical protein